MDELSGLTANSIEVLRLAAKEAQALGCTHITTTDLLVALMKYPNGPWNMLVLRNISPATIATETTRMVEEPLGTMALREVPLPFSAIMDLVLMRASFKQKSGMLTPTTLLAALLDVDGSDALLRLKKLEFPLAPLQNFFRKHLRAPAHDDVANFVRKGETLARGYRFSRRSRTVIERASKAAADQGQMEYDTNYLLYGLAATPGSICSALLHEHSVDAKTLKAAIGELTTEDPNILDGTIEYALMNAEVQSLLPAMRAVAERHNSLYIEPDHMLLALLLRESESYDFLTLFKVDRAELIDDLVRAISNPGT